MGLRCSGVIWCLVLAFLAVSTAALATPTFTLAVSFAMAVFGRERARILREPPIEGLTADGGTTGVVGGIEE